MAIRTILFDLDGTLLDTLADLTASVNYAMERFALPTLPAAQVRRCLGRGIRYLVACCVPGGEAHPEFQDIFRAFRSYYDGHCRDLTRPYDGVGEMLTSLRAAGYQMALVSNKVDSAVQILYQDFYRDTLAFAVGQREGLRVKPAPDMPLLAMKRLGADPAQTVYVGDSEVDFETAQNSGLPCVLVTWGFRDRPELERLDAAAMIDSPEELLPLLERL